MMRLTSLPLNLRHVRLELVENRSSLYVRFSLIISEIA